jgi:DNA-binding response OmpR family regulator
VTDANILDLRLPGEDGMQIAQRLRAQSTVPILMVTGRTDEADRVMGLELGADDYLTKPFSPRELLARVRALLRRARRVPPWPTSSASAHTVRHLGVERRAAQAEVRRRRDGRTHQR